MIETIITYILAGIEDAEIASIVGCSPAYVIQVKAREDYDEVVKKIEDKEALKKAEEVLEKKYVNLESRVLKAVEDNLGFADFKDLSRVMDSLIRRRTQSAGITINNNGQGSSVDLRRQTVVLQLPQAAVPEIRLNSQREVVGIGNASLAPMAGPAVRKLFHKMGKDAKRNPLVLEQPEESAPPSPGQILIQRILQEKRTLSAQKAVKQIDQEQPGNDF